MKKLLYKIHLYISLPVGLIVSIICLTGSAMVFDEELHQLFHPNLYSVKEVKSDVLPINELVEKLSKIIPDEKVISGVQLFPEESATYRFSIEGERRTSFFVDQYSGEFLGSRNKFEKGGFYRTMFHMHRWLMDYKKGELSIGKNVVGISTILLVIILITGFFIWLPRGIRSFKKGMTINIAKGWKRFWYDLHVVGGVYIGAWLMVLSLTGLMWSFSWYRPAVFSIFGVEQSVNSPKKDEVKEEKSAIKYENWSAVLNQVKQKEEGATSLTVKDGEVVAYNRKYGNNRAYDRYTFDKDSGVVISIIPYSTRPETSRFMGWVYAIHVGSWGGIWSKILTFIVALLGGILPLTGYYLWFKKEFRKKK